MSGPLAGVRVVEIAGLAPAPFAGMVLADFGADVVRVDRADVSFNTDTLARGKRSVALNLKAPEGVAALLRLLDRADVLIEPFRPGVMERLGLGPDVVLRRNPRLVYARMTGFGQTGPYAAMAGHDINYIAISGMLAALGRKDENPLFPLNLLGDFAGGGMLCAMGILIALLERAKSNKGQVVDAAMCDGAAYLGTFVYNMARTGLWAVDGRGSNMLDSGAHFYETYKTKDGKFMAVGAIESQFYAELLKGLGLTDADLPRQMDQEHWPAMKTRFAQVFATKTRSEWAAIFDGTDACVTPIMDMTEVMDHKHVAARSILVPGHEDGPEPAPAPRLSRTPAVSQARVRPAPQVGEHSAAVLAEYGFSADEIAALTAPPSSGGSGKAKGKGKSKL